MKGNNQSFTSETSLQSYSQFTQESHLLESSTVLRSVTRHYEDEDDTQEHGTPEKTQLEILAKDSPVETRISTQPTKTKSDPDKLRILPIRRLFARGQKSPSEKTQEESHRKYQRLLVSPLLSDSSSSTKKQSGSDEFEAKLTGSSMEGSMDEHEEVMMDSPWQAARGLWSNNVEFLLVTIGDMCGFGNVWRFPYLAFKYGGGTFLCTYLVLNIVLGIPLVYLEMSLGQYTGMGPIAQFTNLAPIAQGIGWAMMISLGLFVIYYNVISAWSLFYLVASFWNVSGPLLWAYFDPLPNIGCKASYNDTNGSEFAAEDFFFNSVYHMNSTSTGIGQPQYKLVLCLLMVWTITGALCLRSIKSFGVAYYFFDLFPFVSLLALCIAVTQVPGSTEGITQYFYPNFTKFSDITPWGEAAAQVMYSLSIAFGTLSNLASHNKFNAHSLSIAVIASFANGVMSLLAGLVVFSTLGVLASKKKTSISAVVGGGPQLAFVLYAEALSDWRGCHVWSILFFLTVLVMGLSTQVVGLDTLVTSFCDHFRPLKCKRWIVVTSFSLTLFLLGLPMVTARGFIIIEIFSRYCESYSRLYIALLELMVVLYLFGRRPLMAMLRSMRGRPGNALINLFGSSGYVWQVLWLVPLPIILIIALATVVIYAPSTKETHTTVKNLKINAGGRLFGWILVFWPLLLIIVFACVRTVLCLRKGPWSNVFNLFEPTTKWNRRHKSIVSSHKHHVPCASLDLKNAHQPTNRILNR